MSIRLGKFLKFDDEYDEFGIFNNIAKRNHARVIFLNLVGKMVPSCWEDLYKGIDHYNEFLNILGAEKLGWDEEDYLMTWVVFKKRQNNQFYKFINEWMNKYNLKEKWIVDLILQIFKCWALSENKNLGQYLIYIDSNYVKLNQYFHWKIESIKDKKEDEGIIEYPDTLVFHLADVHKEPIYNRKFSVEWNIMEETKEEFNNKLKKEKQQFLKKIESVKKEYNMKLSKLKQAKYDSKHNKIPESELRHFKWFIKYQLEEFSTYKLVELYNYSRSTITEGINSIADLINVNRHYNNLK